MPHRVTYQYTTVSNTMGKLTVVQSADPKRILEEAEKARRKGQLIRLIDNEQGTAHAFPADRLIDIAIERYEPGTAS